MPRGDRTGPAGRGPKTGRAAGYCAGYDQAGFANPEVGRGRGGRGRGGRGRGFGWGARARAEELAPERDDEVESLRARADRLSEELAELRQCLAEHESNER